MDKQIQVTHKGRTWFELTMQGVTAHANNPWRGADTIAAMVETVCHVCKTTGGYPVHEDLGMSTVTFEQITGRYRPYAVPDSCKVWTDMHLVLPTDTTAAKNIVRRAVKAVEAEIAGVRGSYTVTGDRPYVEKDSNSRLPASLRSICDRVTGEDTYTSSSNGYTNTAVIVEILGSRNCMSYGPDNLRLAHRPNGYISYEDVYRRRRILAGLARREAFFPFAF